MRPRWLPVAIAAVSVVGCTRVTIPTPTQGEVSLLAYVTEFGTNQVDVVSITRQSPEGPPIKVGQGPVRAILSPGGSQDYLYVANKTDGTVSFVNRRTASVERNVPAGADPEDLTFETISSSDPTQEQYLFVSNPSSQTVTRINVATQNADATWNYQSQSTDPLGSTFTPAGIVADPGTPYVYVVSSKPLPPQSGCQTNCTTTGVVSVLKNQAGAQFSEYTSFTLPGAVQPYRMVIDPKTHNLFISDRGKAQVFEVQNPSGGQPTVTPIVIPNGSPTWGLALSPDGQTLYATMPAANEYVVIPVGTQQAKAPFGTGGTQPEALALSNDGNSLWIGNVGSSAIYTAALSGNGCNAQQPCQTQGPIPYSLDTSSSQPPGDIVLAPGI